MLKRLVVWTLLFVCVEAQAQKWNVYGQVVDSLGQPVQGASVQLQGTGKGMVTREDGRFQFRKLDSRSYTLEVSYSGFHSRLLDIDPRVGGHALLITLRDRIDGMQEVRIIAGPDPFLSMQRLPDLSGVFLMAGKKTEVISLQQVDANVTLKTGRQLFAKVPGVFVYDMDGSGNQVNIATRSLDAHRSWEYNVRHNGIITNSDMYGYPASHFNPPMESIERIELVRGTASLQYGAQFGGMINYVSRKPDTSKPVSVESINTLGSFGLFSTYNAVGGKSGRWTYYGYFSKRVADGYRENARSESDAQFLSLGYQASERLQIKAEMARSYYLYRHPGPLSDSMFRVDPRMATRSRNWYSPEIYLPSLQANWQAGKRLHVQATLSGLFGTRSSVQFLGFSDTRDTINPATGQYKNRQVDIDQFNSLTAELRAVYTYTLFGKSAVLAGGVQYMHNQMRRRQQGKGTTGSDYDLSLVDPTWGRDLWFRTRNLALFVEQALYITPDWSVSPGMRFESGITRMSGRIVYYDSARIPLSIDHRFPLLGINSQYRFGKVCKVYGGISQAYRPVIFKDVIPTSAFDVIDSNLIDARGFNAEIGVSGRWKDWLSFDISFFHLQYLNRMGSMVLENAAGNSYNFRTNTGDSRTRGIEFYLEASLLKRTRNFSLTVFTSTAWMDARYTQASFVAGGKNVDVSGNRVESAPVWTSRNGMRLGYRGYSLSMQYSYVSESFSDPQNTLTPSPNGARGLVPSYGLWDLDLSAPIHPQVRIRAGINNLLNTSYFTKRPVFYPDPGIWPSDGRNVYFTIMLKI